MGKFGKKIFICVFILVLFLGLPARLVSAEEASAYVYAPETVEVGETFTITVGFTPDIQVGSCDIVLQFDSENLEFVAGDSPIAAEVNQSQYTPNKLIAVRNANMGETSGSVVANITFRAKYATASVAISITDASAAREDGDYPDISGLGSASIRIEHGSPAPVITTTESVPEEPYVEPAVPVETNPPETTTTTTAAPPKPFTKQDFLGGKLKVAEMSDDYPLPEDVTAAEVNFGNYKGPGYHLAEPALDLMLLQNAAGTPAWYYYDDKNDCCVPFALCKQGEEHFVFALPVGKIPFKEANSGWKLGYINSHDSKVPAFSPEAKAYMSLLEYEKAWYKRQKLEKDGDLQEKPPKDTLPSYLRLVFLLDKKGVRTPYLYDTEADQMMRYSSLLTPLAGTYLLMEEKKPEATAVTATTTALRVDVTTAATRKGAFGGHFLTLLLGGLLLLSWLFAIIWIVLRRKKRTEKTFIDIP